MGPQRMLEVKKEKRERPVQKEGGPAVTEDNHTNPVAKQTLQRENGDNTVDIPVKSHKEDVISSLSNTANMKRDRDEFESDKENDASQPAKKKKYKSKKERQQAKPTEDEVGGAGDNLEPAIAQMDPALLADHFAKTIKRWYKDDTALELEERYLPSSTFMDTTSATADRKKNKLEAYLEALVGDRSELVSPSHDKASPHTIVLCSSGIRGADLGRVLRTYETDNNKVAKLFAKHFKIEQQAVFLRKTPVGFGVCTPDRVRKLMEMKALKTDQLARIVIDGSYLDEKKRGFWNMGEIFRPMLDLLKMREVQNKIKDGSLKVMVF